MSTNAANVSAGKPKIGGYAHWAPAGTTAPTDAVTALAAAFLDMGFISEDGVTNSTERESNDIKDWGGTTVMSVQNGFTDTFSATFIEALNLDLLKRIYGGSNVSGSLADGVTVNVNSSELETGIWVFDLVLNGDVKHRIVIPSGKITEVGKITYNSSDAIGYEVTITAFPDATGDTHHNYYKSA